MFAGGKSVSKRKAWNFQLEFDVLVEKPTSLLSIKKKFRNSLVRKLQLLSCLERVFFR